MGLLLLVVYNLYILLLISIAEVIIALIPFQIAEIIKDIKSYNLFRCKSNRLFDLFTLSSASSGATVTITDAANSNLTYSARFGTSTTLYLKLNSFYHPKVVIEGGPSSGTIKMDYKTY